MSLRGHETRTLPVANVEVFEQWDVVLVRGLHNPRNSMLWQYAAEAGKHALLVYDLDDDIWGWRPGSDEDKYWNDSRREMAERNIQCADLVTCPTSTLADVLCELNPRVAVLPNTIPEKLLSLLPQKRDRFIVGWQGAQQHIKDLHIIYNPVLRLMLRHSNVEFHLWGPQGTLDFPDALAPRIVTHPWVPRVWDHYLRLNMDIGLAPIDVTERFNETKSDIKLREYAALGIPFIASKSKAYTNTALSARGMVAESEREWEEGLEELYRNANLRLWMAEQGRLRARLWTTEENAREWEQAYVRAEHARRLRKAAAGNGSASTEWPGKYTSTTLPGGETRAVVNVPSTRT
jgi:glycosyltransferase involved in cell wall biosynthesis